MARDNDKTKMDVFTLPEGRVINCSLFKKDAFNEKSVPSYKIELAFPADSDEMADLEDKLLDAADARWGEGAGEDPDLVLPLIDGDKLAKKREKKGKAGDAYKGMMVIRANTIYNKDGQDGPGGIQVLGPDVEPIEPARSGDVYQGCYGVAAVSIGFYEDDDGNNAIKLYLSAFQKTRDGERLVTASDRSNLFKPVGREAGGGSSGRRRRRG
jgi:hypothetical protein